MDAGGSATQEQRCLKDVGTSRSHRCPHSSFPRIAAGTQRVEQSRSTCRGGNLGVSTPASNGSRRLGENGGDYQDLHTKANQRLLIQFNSRYNRAAPLDAGVAELVDAPDSKSGSFGSAGSIPALGTNGLLKTAY